MRTTMFNGLILLGGVTGDCQQLENRPANAFHPEYPDNVKSHHSASDFLFHFIRADKYLQQCIFDVSDLREASVTREREDPRDNRSQRYRILTTGKSFPRVERAS